MKLKGSRFGLIIIVIVLLSLFLFGCYHKHLNSIQPSPIGSISKISGVVYGDSIGAPIQAFVALLLNSTWVAKTQTNGRGEFEFSNIKPGKYGLLVDGYRRFEYAEFYNVKAAPDSLTVVTMQLRPSYSGGISIPPEERGISLPLYLKIDVLPINNSNSLRNTKKN